ncbi:MAG: hypothetical protein IPM96_18825 [Ignavibacteria bacterium]|nr:hypothetical protein [Ignavibacteria bacterium]
MNDISGKFYYRQKLFEEKLLYRYIELPYVYRMVIERLYVSIGDSNQHVVLDEREGSKGFKRLRINFKRVCKGLRYTLFRKITGSGEKPFNILNTSIIIVVLWSMIYSFIETTTIFNFMNYFYQSFFIFTTFGLFDNSILLNNTNKIWISLEIALGIIFINGFIVVLHKKTFTLN